MLAFKVNADGKGSGKGASEQRKERDAWNWSQSMDFRWSVFFICCFSFCTTIFSCFKICFLNSFFNVPDNASCAKNRTTTSHNPKQGSPEGLTMTNESKFGTNLAMQMELLEDENSWAWDCLEYYGSLTFEVTWLLPFSCLRRQLEMAADLESDQLLLVTLGFV